MPTPNPEHDPAWEIAHNYHRDKYDSYHKERARIDEARDDLTRRRVPFESAQSLALEKARDAINDKMKFHLDAKHETFRSQFPTVQEFAAVRFAVFDHAIHPRARAPVTDFEQFTTIDQVIDAWNKEAEARRDAMYSGLAHFVPSKPGHT
ncbi:MAG: hypothetical protein WBV36_04150 [Terriglobales bacterium]